MQGNTASTLTLFELILLISSSGFFGGVVSAIFDILHIKTPAKKMLMYAGEILGKALIGIAGAFGVTLAGFWTVKLTAEATVKNEIFLISLCVVSGFISYRLLPKIGKALEDQIAQTDKKAEEAKIEAAKSTTRSIEYSAIITSAATALARDQVYHDTPEAITNLENIRHFYSLDRTIHIYLGRLYRSMGNYDQAVTILREFIRNRMEEKNKRGPSLHDAEDIAAAYFNIACYCSLKAQKSTLCTKEELDGMKESAYEALSRSIELWPKNKESAETDPDFDFIKEEEKFKNLIGNNKHM